MNTETISQLVFECGLQTPAVIVPAIALLLLCGWMLFRERQTLGLKWAFGFWCLRALALSVLVWMFLQPARMTETKSTLPKSIAVIVDNSDSMQVIDPAGEGQEIRWQLVNSTADDLSPRDTQTALDSANLALDVAQSRWTIAQSELQAGFDPAVLRDRFDEVAFALNRASILLGEQFCSHWSDSNDQQRATEFAEQCIELAEFVTELDLKKSAANESKQIQRSQESLQALVDLSRLANTWGRTVSDKVSQSLGATGTSDRQAQVLKLAQDTETQTAETLNSNLTIKRFTFDDHLKPVLSTSNWPEPTIRQPDLQPFDKTQVNEQRTSTATNLTAAIEQISQLAHSQSIRSVVFLTDGAHNASGTSSPVEVAVKRNDLSFNFVAIGSLKQPLDLNLSHVGHPSSVIRGDKILIEALISANGFEGQTVNLQLRADDELIDQKELPINADIIDLKHSFTVPTDKQGSIEFELSIVPLSGEISTTNNRSIFRVGVVRDKIKIMLADRISRWEFRYLDQLLVRDEHLEHEMILFDPRLRATGKLKDDAALPTTLEGWNQYDVAVIGDLTPDQMTIQSQESLVEFVKEKGGVAILIAGRSGMPHRFEDQPLETLLPVEKSDVNNAADKYFVGVNRTAVNLESLYLDDSRPKSEELWKQVFEEQPITWLSEYSTPRPAARRLLDAIPMDFDGELDARDADQQPAWVCWQQIGAGRVVYLSAPDTYRLRYRRGDQLHHRFWAQLLRWITSNDPGSENGNVKLETDKVSYAEGEPIEVSAYLSNEIGEPISDAEINATFEGGDDEATVIAMAADETQPGRYIAKVTELNAGAYRISLQDDVNDLTVDGEKVGTFINVITVPDVERVNTTCNRPLMKQIAQASGGYVIQPTALAEWLTLQTGMPETVSQIERMPLWNRWSCLWIAFLCLATEWCVRRLKGLT